MSFEMPQFEVAQLRKVVPDAPDEALGLINSLLQVSPQKRITAQQALQHDYFKVKGGFRSESILNSIKGHDDQEDIWRRAKYRVGRKCKL